MLVVCVSSHLSGVDRLILSVLSGDMEEGTRAGCGALPGMSSCVCLFIILDCSGLMRIITMWIRGIGDFAQMNVFQ
jgi:hypothetical protein